MATSAKRLYIWSSALAYCKPTRPHPAMRFLAHCGPSAPRTVVRAVVNKRSSVASSTLALPPQRCGVGEALRFVAFPGENLGRSFEIKYEENG